MQAKPACCWEDSASSRVACRSNADHIRDGQPQKARQCTEQDRAAQEHILWAQLRYVDETDSVPSAFRETSQRHARCPRARARVARERTSEPARVAAAGGGRVHAARAPVGRRGSATRARRGGRRGAAHRSVPAVHGVPGKLLLGN